MTHAATLDGRASTQALDSLVAAMNALRPAVDAHITPQRVARYLTALAEAPAPSTAATAMRTPVLRRLLEEDGVFSDGTLRLDDNFANTTSTVLIAGNDASCWPLWYFAHLDTISYLVQPFDGGRHPLVPFCYHLTRDGVRQARAYRYELSTGSYVIAGEGRLESVDGAAYFAPADPALRLRAGDRVVPVAPCVPTTDDGIWSGHFDNAGGVAALAVAAPVIARAGVDALIAFPDEEEGPNGTGSQVMSRGGSRVVSRLAPPDLAIVCDMQQAGTAQGGAGSAPRMGSGGVLSEFSSLARGAVTPPHLYALARHFCGLLPAQGVAVQESDNAYTSRSDDVSILLKTPNILLLGFPGTDRHFDRATPRAALSDIVDLSKALAYVALLRPALALLSPGRSQP